MLLQPWRRETTHKKTPGRTNSMNDLTTKIVRKAADISPEAWNALFPNAPKIFDLYRLIDESNFEGFSFYYVAVYKKNDIAGIAPCFALDYHLDTTVDGPLKEITVRIKKVLPKLFTLKCIFCGSPINEGKIGIVDQYQHETMSAILHGMGNIAKEENASVLIFKDYFSEYKNTLDPIIGEGFCKVCSYPSVKMSIDFKSFDEYLKTLSPASRDGLRRKLKKTDKLVKIDLIVTDNADDTIDEVYALYLQTYAKSRIKWGEIPKKFFADISGSMKENVKYFQWRINGKLVAFNLCLSLGDILISTYIGLDYSVAYEYNLYFATFRDEINWCIQNNIKAFHSGEFAYEAKKRLGFSFVPKHYYVKHRSRLINPFFKILCYMLQPKNFDKILR